MSVIESVVASFAVFYNIYIYRAIEIPLTTYAQYSQIYLIISRLLIFHKSVFIFLLRNDTPRLVFETNITFFPSVLVSFSFFFKKIILFFLRVKKLSFPINFTICNFYNPYKIAREIFFCFYAFNLSRFSSSNFQREQSSNGIPKRKLK